MDQNEFKQPFFAQFLQGQETEEKHQYETSASKESALTLKYPSDRDEDPRDF